MKYKYNYSRYFVFQRPPAQQVTKWSESLGLSPLRTTPTFQPCFWRLRALHRTVPAIPCHWNSHTISTATSSAKSAVVWRPEWSAARWTSTLIGCRIRPPRLVWGDFRCGRRLPAASAPVSTLTTRLRRDHRLTSASKSFWAAARGFEWVLCILSIVNISTIRFLINANFSRQKPITKK